MPRSARGLCGARGPGRAVLTAIGTAPRTSLAEAAGRTLGRTLTSPSEGGGTRAPGDR